MESSQMQVVNLDMSESLRMHGSFETTSTTSEAGDTWEGTMQEVSSEAEGSEFEWAREADETQAMVLSDSSSLESREVVVSNAEAVAPIQLSSRGTQQLTRSVGGAMLQPFFRLSQSLRRTVLHHETEEAFGHVFQLMKSLFHDPRLSYADMLMGTMMVAAYHEHQQLRTERPVPVRELRDTLYFMKFASAAYGWMLVESYFHLSNLNAVGTLGGLMGGVSGARDSLAAFSRHTGIPERDVLDAQWEAEAFCPAHYICLDQSRKVVIVAIRGTMHQRDALTDLVGHSEPFFGGYAHAGMVKCAWNKYMRIIPILLTALEGHPGFTAVIVGHSLGAGTATLLTYILRANHPLLPLRTYSFASPCVLSLNLAKELDPVVTTVAVGDDIVPRLSVGSLEHLKEWALILVKEKPGLIQRGLQMLGGAVSRRTARRLERWLRRDIVPDIEAVRAKLLEIEIPEKLYPAGRILNFYREKGARKKHVFSAEVSDVSLFGDIIVSTRLFADHMPDFYEYVLASLLDRAVKQDSTLVGITPVDEDSAEHSESQPYVIATNLFTSSVSIDEVLQASVLMTPIPAPWLDPFGSIEDAFWDVMRPVDSERFNPALHGGEANQDPMEKLIRFALYPLRDAALVYFSSASLREDVLNLHRFACGEDIVAVYAAPRAFFRGNPEAEMGFLHALGGSGSCLVYSASMMRSSLGVSLSDGGSSSRSTPTLPRNR